MRKIYISGKITGDSGYIEKFKAAEKEIRQQCKGCGVINPALTGNAGKHGTRRINESKPLPAGYVRLCLSAA